MLPLHTLTESESRLAQLLHVGHGYQLSISATMLPHWTSKPSDSFSFHIVSEACHTQLLSRTVSIAYSINHAWYKIWNSNCGEWLCGFKIQYFIVSLLGDVFKLQQNFTWPNLWWPPCVRCTGKSRELYSVWDLRKIIILKVD